MSNSQNIPQSGFRIFQDLFYLLNNPAHNLVIVGQKYSGKTTLINHFIEKSTENLYQKKAFSIDIDLLKCSTVRKIYKSLCRQLKNHYYFVNTKIPEVGECRDSELVTHLVNLLNESPATMLVIDHIDLLVSFKEKKKNILINFFSKLFKESKIIMVASTSGSPDVLQVLYQLNPNYPLITTHLLYEKRGCVQMRYDISGNFERSAKAELQSLKEALYQINIKKLITKKGKTDYTEYTICNLWRIKRYIGGKLVCYKRILDFNTQKHRWTKVSARGEFNLPIITLYRANKVFKADLYYSFMSYAIKTVYTAWNLAQEKKSDTANPYYTLNKTDYYYDNCCIKEMAEIQFTRPTQWSRVYTPKFAHYFLKEIMDSQVLGLYFQTMTDCHLGRYISFHIAYYDVAKRIKKESPNLIPLLKLVYKEHWYEDNIFAADRWTKDKNSDFYHGSHGVRSKKSFNLLKKQPYSIVHWYSVNESIYHSLTMEILLQAIQPYSTTEKLYMVNLISNLFFDEYGHRNIDAQFSSRDNGERELKLILPKFIFALIDYIAKELANHRTLTFKFKNQYIGSGQKMIFRELFQHARLIADYLNFEEIERLIRLPKNMNLSRYIEFTQAWHERIQAEKKAKNLTIRQSWSEILEEFTLQDCQIKPLVNNVMLFLEGEEMHHCVANYTDYCVQADYRIFSITPLDTSSNIQRCTAAFCLKKEKYKLDQIYSYCNESVNKSTQTLAIAIEKQMNCLNEDNTLNGQK